MKRHVFSPTCSALPTPEPMRHAAAAEAGERELVAVDRGGVERRAGGRAELDVDEGAVGEDVGGDVDRRAVGLRARRRRAGVGDAAGGERDGRGRRGGAGARRSAA